MKFSSEMSIFILSTMSTFLSQVSFAIETWNIQKARTRAFARECSLEGNHKSSLSCSQVIASLFCSKEHPQVFFPLGLGLFCTILFCNTDMKYSEGNHKSMHKLLPLCFALKSIHRSFFSLCLDLLYVFFSSNGASHRRRLQPKRVHRVLPEYV